MNGRGSLFPSDSCMARLHPSAGGRAGAIRKSGRNLDKLRGKSQLLVLALGVPSLLVFLALASGDTDPAREPSATTELSEVPGQDVEEKLYRLREAFHALN